MVATATNRQAALPLHQSQSHHARHAAAIPQTSLERIKQELYEDEPDAKRQPKADTVLYLAYGSNMCAQTFLDSRNIRPLSQVNVSAPTLRLTFNLPGFPYVEPCFANVDYRKIPDKPKMPNPPKVPPPFDPPAYSQGQWDGGLMGVVYEVTAEDYRQIIRTEGGSSSYQEIVVPCVPLPPQISHPEKPLFPELPKPFIARTLFAPYVPLDKPDDPEKGAWWRRLLLGAYRPDPDYAQASARYLKLLSDGVEEHSFPEAYQNYIKSLQPYTITSCRQKVGRALLMVFAAPILLIFMPLSKILSDDDGKFPPTVVAVLKILQGLLWMWYDYVLKPVFGDGERTEDEGKRCSKPASRERLLPDEEQGGLSRSEGV